MAVTITTINLIKDVSGDTREEQALESLRSSLEKEFKDIPTANGRICLLSNVTFGGGSVSEVDIVLLCDLNGVTFHLYDPEDQNNKDIVVQRLCYVIEVKDHDYKGVNILGNGFNVKYDGVWHPVSSQSRKQKFEFENYLKRYLNYSPYIYNFIWFREIIGADLDSIFQRASDGIAYDDNVLPKFFSIKTLIQKTIYVIPKSVHWNQDRTMGWMNCCSGADMITDIVNHFTRRKIIVGKLTQERLNILAMKNAAADIQDLEENKFTLFEGRAGTGKTIKLLQTAIMLKTKGKRCILLTYNHALISDINRTLFLAGIYSKPDAPTVQTSTLHAFFLDLMYITGVRDNKEIENADDYFNRGGYIKELQETCNYVTKELSKSDVSCLKEMSDTIDWDYILIDEAQDWLKEEKEVLFKIYGSERIIVADGVDQFMRSDNKANWLEGITVSINKKKDEVCLRQKPNLVRFTNGIAHELGLDWHVKMNNAYSGGRVIVVSNYTTDLHAELLNDGKKAKAEPYDILFLVPPQDVIDDHFIKYDLYQNNGVYLFDGTNSANREYYSLDNSLCRLYQYESCRGLEGWSVICYDFDLLIQSKLEFFKTKLEHGEMKPLLGSSITETAKKMTYLWALMPLTRPIDTLVITLNNPNSEIGQLLYSMHNDKRHYDGIIEWRIKDTIL